jgi:hypothetical protein
MKEVMNGNTFDYHFIYSTFMGSCKHLFNIRVMIIYISIVNPFEGVD